MATLIDKGPKLPASHWIAPDVIARQGDFVWREFVRVGVRVLARIAADQERTRRDFDEAEQRIIREIPGIRAEARIAKPSQFVTCSDALDSVQVTRTHARNLSALGRTLGG